MRLWILGTLILGMTACGNNGEEALPIGSADTSGDTSGDNAGDGTDAGGEDSGGDTTGDGSTGGGDTGDDPEPPVGASFDDPAIQAVLDLPSTPFNYAAQTLPDHFNGNAVRALLNTPVDNPITDTGATLGRVLFYDTLLSDNETLSCASCHSAGSAFNDTAQFSTGFEGGLTGRNSMPLMNVAYYANGAMFWDERAGSLEEQVLMPIQDAVEMGLTLEQLVARVADAEYYAPLFEIAFGDTTVTSERISFALAQFVRSIVSSGSRYDTGLAATGGNVGPDFANFTDSENRGKTLFFTGNGGPGGPGGPGGAGGANCAVCHADANGAPGGGATQAILQMGRARNNGLTETSTDDLGL
ncbi:MAG: cytochrome-c peroxidase, partial [Myxococcota bacterium]